jgi:hypothetical protein
MPGVKYSEQTGENFLKIGCLTAHPGRAILLNNTKELDALDEQHETLLFLVRLLLWLPETGCHWRRLSTGIGNKT